jgi:hypothetical protein
MDPNPVSGAPLYAQRVLRHQTTLTTNSSANTEGEIPRRRDTYLAAILDALQLIFKRSKTKRDYITLYGELELRPLVLQE